MDARGMVYEVNPPESPFGKGGTERSEQIRPHPSIKSAVSKYSIAEVHSEIDIS